MLLHTTQMNLKTTMLNKPTHAEYLSGSIDTMFESCEKWPWRWRSGWCLPAQEGQGPAGDLECSVCVALPKCVHFVVIAQTMFLWSCVVLYVIFWSFKISFKIHNPILMLPHWHYAQITVIEMGVPKLLSYTFVGIFLVYSPMWYFTYPGFRLHEFKSQEQSYFQACVKCL